MNRTKLRAAFFLLVVGLPTTILADQPEAAVYLDQKAIEKYQEEASDAGRNRFGIEQILEVGKELPVAISRNRGNQPSEEKN